MMKSTDIEKVNSLLGEMDALKNLITATEAFEDKELHAEIYCEGKNLCLAKIFLKKCLLQS